MFLSRNSNLTILISILCFYSNLHHAFSMNDGDNLSSSHDSFLTRSSNSDPKQTQTPHTPEISSQTPYLLLVEDQKTSYMGLIMKLTGRKLQDGLPGPREVGTLYQGKRYAVLHVETLEEIKRLLTAHPLPFKAVLMDYQFPKTKGTSAEDLGGIATALIKEHFGSLQLGVIIIPNSSQPDNNKKIIDKGGYSLYLAEKGTGIKAIDFLAFIDKAVASPENQLKKEEFSKIHDLPVHKEEPNESVLPPRKRSYLSPAIGSPDPCPEPKRLTPPPLNLNLGKTEINEINKQLDKK